MISPSAFFYSLLGGVVPAVAWLLFWLQEDDNRPEPRELLITTFLLGMLAVPLVVPFEQITRVPGNSLLTFFYWAIIEELFKFGAAWFVLRRREDDEPIDPLIYMMTAALGFVAIENTLFILGPILSGDITQGLITGNIRFVGASLLHTISSAAIGLAMGLSFYNSPTSKRIHLFVGIILAVVLHTAFNFFIIKETPGLTLATLGFVWIAVVILILLFEKVKTIHSIKNTP